MVMVEPGIGFAHYLGVNRPKLKIILTIAAALLLFEGCGAQNLSPPSISPGSLQVSTLPNISSSNGSIYQSKEPGGNRLNLSMFSLASGDNPVGIEVKGDLLNSDSVLVRFEVDGKEISIQSDIKGHFDAIILVDQTPTSIQFTPISSNSIGETVNFDVANIVSNP